MKDKTLSDLVAPNPPKSYKNLDFLNSHDARSIRVLCELIEPDQRFRNEKVQNTVVFFGSARSVDSTRAAEKSEALLKQAAEESDLNKREVLEANASYVRKLAAYYDAGVELARRVTAWSLRLENEADRFYICSGGGPGMMEAANKGAHLAGGKSIGLGISLPFEQHLNPYCTPELSFEYHYFFTRKYWFLYPAKALVVFPGGFGTMDELFELLTLIQTHKIQKKMPILLFGKDFWNDILNFDAFRKWGVISDFDLELFRIVDDIDEAERYLIEQLETHFLPNSR
ncbi:MAG: LOG family protein [Puniceicoccaceae bacterium]